MYSAGLTLERAIQGLASEERHPKLKKVLTNVGENIRKGLSLSEALQRHPGVFSTLFVSLTKAGEVSGNLEKLSKISSWELACAHMKARNLFYYRYCLIKTVVKLLPIIVKTPFIQCCSNISHQFLIITKITILFLSNCRRTLQRK